MKKWLRNAFLASATLALATAAQAQVVINEVVYDSDGSDTMTWIELKGEPETNLDGWLIAGINGNGGGEYTSVDLTGFTIPADGYFVVSEDAATPNSDLVAGNDVDMQNGPDSIELRDATGAVVDAVGYAPHDADDVFAGEGSPAEDQVPPFSLARCPDGEDTDDNSQDFALDDTPTPGEANDGDCSGPGDPTPRTLCEIAADDADGFPLLFGEFVEVTGVCVSPSNTFSTFNQDFKITDGECCVTVFQSGSISPVVNVGDEVRVIGTVAFFNGLTEIDAPNLEIMVVSTGNSVPVIPVTTGELAMNGELYESCLCEIRCAELTGGGDEWPAEGSNANVEIDDGSGPLVMRIDADTDVDGTPAPTAPFTVRGVGGQFDSSSPYDSGYQFLPRSNMDLDRDDPDCAEPQGACCIPVPPGPGFICEIQTQADCETMGEYQGDGTTCDPDPCPDPLGACCLPDGTCNLFLEFDCDAVGGEFLGQGTVCEPNPCPTPTHEKTWGQIKGDFHKQAGESK